MPHFGELDDGGGGTPAPVTGQAFTYSATAPLTPTPGDVWVDSDTGIEYRFIDDGTSTQWVEF